MRNPNTSYLFNPSPIWRPGLWLLALLGGCAQHPTAPLPTSSIDHPPPTIAQQAEKSHLSCWQIEGKVGVKPLKDRTLKGGSAFLKWQQNEAHYSVQLNGPLGQGSVIIKGSPDGVTLTDRHGQLESDRAEQLLESAIGWSIPIDHLRWWIKGLPDPLDTSTYLLDSNGHLQTLQQAGWRIEYPRLQPIAAPHQTLTLPRTIRATHPRLKTTLSLNRWHFSGCEP